MKENIVLVAGVGEEIIHKAVYGHISDYWLFCTNPVEFLWYSNLLFILEQQGSLGRHGSNIKNKIIDFEVWNVREATPKSKID